MLHEITEVIKEDEMPLSSYTLIHTYAKLTPEQKLRVINWADSTSAIIRANNPADSLIMKRKKRD